MRRSHTGLTQTARVACVESDDIQAVSPAKRFLPASSKPSPGALLACRAAAINGGAAGLAGGRAVAVQNAGGGAGRDFAGSGAVARQAATAPGAVQRAVGRVAGHLASTADTAVGAVVASAIELAAALIGALA